MIPHYSDDTVTLYHGDAADTLAQLPAGSVDCIVTSPPYFGLRDYGVDGQLGAEATPGQFVASLVDVFHEARRVLADDGTLWLNLGDSYSATPPGKSDDPMRSSTLTNPKGAASTMRESVRRAAIDRTKFLPPKNMMGMPWRTAFGLQDDGWILRNSIIWHKPNAMPESVTDRLSTRHENVFMFSKSRRYWFDLDPIREPLSRPEAVTEGILFGGKSPDVGRRRGSTYGGKHGTSGDTPPGTKPQTNKGATGERHTLAHERGRNPGDVWTIPTSPFPGAHFATFPLELARRCMLAGCKPGGVVLDPFSGSGTTGLAATENGRRYVGIDLNAEYLDLSLRTRLKQGVLDFGGAA